MTRAELLDINGQIFREQVNHQPSSSNYGPIKEVWLPSLALIAPAQKLALHASPGGSFIQESSANGDGTDVLCLSIEALAAEQRGCW